MTFHKTVDLQFKIKNWIRGNLKPVKKFNPCYGGSMFLLRYCQREIPEATHEEFKQAMARAGYFADCHNTDEHYSKVYFNVSERSVRKLMEKQNNNFCRKEQKEWEQ